MSDIELLIKIPEELYKSIPKDKSDIGYMDMSDWQKIINIVKNGTPLPKRHGRLIDADALENVWHEEFLTDMVSISSGMVNTFYDAPTIIEADDLPPVKPQELCSNCCNGNQIEKAKLCQKSYLAGMEHEQEPKTGHWTKDKEPWGGSQEWKCDKCNHIYDIHVVYSKMPYNFCPNCGARMESEE